jgi:hypothetical protein
MTRARDNIQSSRSREEIDHDQQAQRRAAELRLQMLGALDPVKYQEALDEMHRLGVDPKTSRRTRAGLLAAYAREVRGLVAEKPTVVLNQGAVIDAAGLLRLVAPEGAANTTGCGPALPTPPDTIGLPTPTPVDDLRPKRPEVHVPEDRGARAQEPSPATTSGVWFPPAPTPAAAPPVRPVADGALGDPTGRCPQCHARTDDEQHACPLQAGA